jgi:hypothetical protein
MAARTFAPTMPRVSAGRQCDQEIELRRELLQRIAMDNTVEAIGFTWAAADSDDRHVK